MQPTFTTTDRYSRCIAASKRIRWDIDNAVALCSGCHFAYTKNPANWQKFVEKMWPGRFIQTLRREIYAESRGATSG